MPQQTVSQKTSPHAVSLHEPRPRNQTMKITYSDGMNAKSVAATAAEDATRVLSNYTSLDEATVERMRAAIESMVRATLAPQAK